VSTSPCCVQNLRVSHNRSRVVLELQEQSSAHVSSLALCLCSSAALGDVSYLPLYICCFYQRKRTRGRQQAEISSVPLTFTSLSLAYLDNSQPLVRVCVCAGRNNRHIVAGRPKSPQYPWPSPCPPSHSSPPHRQQEKKKEEKEEKHQKKKNIY
jgi:hypothetical protein